jgi:hypothetical protein
MRWKRWQPLRGPSGAAELRPSLSPEANDGPYACRSKDDLREISKYRTRTDLELKMVQELRAYYLIQGQIVQVDQVDVAAGASQIHVPGHFTKVWTLTRFLSREATGLSPTATAAKIVVSTFIDQSSALTRAGLTV